MYIRDHLDHMLLTLDFYAPADLQSLAPLVDEIHANMYGKGPPPADLYTSLDYMYLNIDAVSETKLRLVYPAVKHLFMRFITLPKIKNER
jgi:hypothetical protein